MRLKDVAFINRRVLPETINPDYSFRYIDISAVDDRGTVAIPSELTLFENAPSRARRLAPPGSTVVSTVRTYLRAIARVPVTNENLVFSTGFAVLEAKQQVEDRFLAYVCRSQQFVDDVVARSVGVSYPAINPGDLGCVAIPMLPLDEQRRIADFLDAETDRIDQLASLRSRQMVQVGERERAWRGYLFLNSKSGVRLRVKHLLRAKPRYGVLVPEFVDDGVPFIRVNSIAGLKNLEGLPMIPETLSKQYARTITTHDDILLSVVGSMGKTTVVTDALVGANVARAVAIIRLNPKHSTSLFAAWIDTAEFLQQAQLATGADSAQPTLGMEDLANFSLRWPTDDAEQKQMESAILEHSLEEEATRTALNRQLALLAERRQALITAAVTGEITV